MSRYTEMDQKMKMWEHKYRRPVNPHDYVLLRIDGKAFHTYTRGLNKPFDFDLMEAMDYAALSLAKNIQGAKFVYTQSDEISILITGWNNISADKGVQPELWMGGIEAKMLSVSASIATAYFNAFRVGTFQESLKLEDFKAGLFDARLWTFPGTWAGRRLVQEYFEWRVEDCQRNAISMQAQAHFSHKELNGKNQLKMVNMLNEINYPWQEVPARASYGQMFYKEPSTGVVSYVDKRTNEKVSTEVTRSVWRATPYNTSPGPWVDLSILPNPYPRKVEAGEVIGAAGSTPNKRYAMGGYIGPRTGAVPDGIHECGYLIPNKLTKTKSEILDRLSNPKEENE